MDKFVDTQGNSYDGKNIAVAFDDDDESPSHLEDADKSFDGPEENDEELNQQLVANDASIVADGSSGDNDTTVAADGSDSEGVEIKENGASLADDTSAAEEDSIMTSEKMLADNMAENEAVKNFAAMFSSFKMKPKVTEGFTTRNSFKHDTAKFEKIRKAEYGLNTKQLRTIKAQQLEEYEKDEAIRQDVAISKVHSFMDAIGKSNCYLFMLCVTIYFLGNYSSDDC